VLRPQRVSTGADSAEVARLAILPEESEPSYSIELTPTAGEGDPSVVRCGLADTFRAQTALVAPESTGVGKLVVVGPATLCAPSIGNSPAILPAKAGAAESISGTSYYSTSTRPFPTTVIVTFDISDPAAPKAVALVQYEGQFQRAHYEDGYAWMFLTASTHQPYSPQAQANSAQQDWTGMCDAQVMPVSRSRRQGAGGAWLDWTALSVVSSCTDVKQIVHSAQELQHATSSAMLLLGVPVPLAEGKAPYIGVPKDMSVSTYVVAWDADVRFRIVVCVCAGEAVTVAVKASCGFLLVCHRSHDPDCLLLAKLAPMP
jgi:hypothetical protein